MAEYESRTANASDEPQYQVSSTFLSFFFSHGFDRVVLYRGITAGDLQSCNAMDPHKKSTVHCCAVVQPPVAKRRLKEQVHPVVPAWVKKTTLSNSHDYMNND